MANTDPVVLDQHKLEQTLSVKALKSALRKQLKTSLGWHSQLSSEDSTQPIHPEMEKLRVLLKQGSTMISEASPLDDWGLYFLIRFDAFIDAGRQQAFKYESKNVLVGKLLKALDDGRITTASIMSHLLVSILKPSASPDPEVNRDQSLTLQAAVGHFAQIFYPIYEADPFDAIRIASSLLALGSGVLKQDENNSHVLYSIHPRNRDMAQVITHGYNRILQCLQAESLPMQINDSFYDPPLVEPPLPVTGVSSNGYHSFSLPLIMGSLPNFNPSRIDQQLRATGKHIQQDFRTINILNGIRYVIDQDVAKELLDMDQAALPDNLDDPGFIPFRTLLLKILGDRPVWFTWQYESRGRLFMHGYHMNMQSFESNKALLSHDKYEYLD